MLARSKIGYEKNHCRNQIKVTLCHFVAGPLESAITIRAPDNCHYEYSTCNIDNEESDSIQGKDSRTSNFLLTLDSIV